MEKRVDNKPAEQLRLSCGEDNCNTLANHSEHPVAEGLLERILSSENLRAALKQVERNKGRAGVDGMPVTKLREHLKKHWQKLCASILDGTYRPGPALRTEIPKPNGGKRFPGIPTVVDRFIQQAIMQVLQAIWDPTFSAFSYGFRPGRSAHQAIYQAHIRELTRRTRGRNIRKIIEELRKYLNGWKAYYGLSQYRALFKELDSWIRRKLRCYLWKQWGRRGYRELRRRGVSRNLAWNTAKSSHGPWRLSHSPALAIALPGKYFDALGLPRLYVRTT